MPDGQDAQPKGIMGSIFDKTKKVAEAGFERTKQGYDQVKGGSIQKGMLDAMKASALSLANTAAEIDAELRDRNSPYEVAFYRVSGSLTLVGGVTFDIHFTKTSLAKQESDFIVIINPRTDSQIRVPRKALAGRETAKVRDPETGEILTVDVGTRTVIS
ncbi:hypothetical protein [Desulfomonile tiedjei]|uniref:Uncharacterized protein n=1 Tax=Desulfomonile tiedjei (strain ATCC 49306 / DSM 6799 / DCB-1) TaxID=706587 RepID=I4C9E0_DESTA|nr:hypothetical protein [Desulfomonile tiedjei]AFM26181.1 hypothetical protein Desti_3531 [Desulfomonile tiedjei DSM 6799]